MQTAKIMHINSFIESKRILEESQGQQVSLNIKLVQYQVYFYEPLKQYDSWKFYEAGCGWEREIPNRIQLCLNFRII